MQITTDLDIATTLCKLEKIFPPSFFDIMVHLPIHLSLEALLGGPVHYRWMYPIEHYMGILKRYLRNRNHPEGSISESYLVNESISLCARYLEEQEWPQTQNNSDPNISVFSSGEELSSGTVYTFEPGDRERAHSYILKNCPEVEAFYNQYMRETNNTEYTFASYFKNKVVDLTDNDNKSRDLQILGFGPTMYSTKFVWCKINGYKFNTEKHDEGLTTQNSGVVVLGDNGSETLSYYGVITDIIQVQYLSSKRVVLFKCKWYDVHSGERGIKVDKYGFESVNVNRILKNQTQDPFILACQAKQVFYAPDMASRPDWNIVTKINPRFTYI